MEGIRIETGVSDPSRLERPPFSNCCQHHRTEWKSPARICQRHAASHRVAAGANIEVASIHMRMVRSRLLAYVR
jgi:hypothetical protein